MRFVLSTISLVVLFFPAVAAAQQPQRLSGPNVSPAVWGVVATPQAPGAHPAVILLPGSSGWRVPYADIAGQLAQSGFVALALDYYAETGPAAAGSKDRPQKWERWRETVRSAAAYLHSLPTVSQKPIALVGYSLGAFLAVSVASSTPTVRAVVDFFGGGGAGSEPLEKEVRGFPPLLILHGEADTVVDVANAKRLREAVLAQGGEVEMQLYPGAEHGFNAPWSPNYSEAIASDSFRRMVEFLHRSLDGQAAARSANRSI